MCELVLPGMRRQGSGRIVNLSSMGGKLTSPGGGFYLQVPLVLRLQRETIDQVACVASVRRGPEVQSGGAFVFVRTVVAKGQGRTGQPGRRRLPRLPGVHAAHDAHIGEIGFVVQPQSEFG